MLRRKIKMRELNGLKWTWRLLLIQNGKRGLHLIDPRNLPKKARGPPMETSI